MKTSARILAVIVLLLLNCTLLLAQKPEILPPSPQKSATAPTPQQAPQVTPQLTKEDLEAFFDGFIPIELQRDDIAGAVVSVVKDGKVLFAKGYGYSDVKRPQAGHGRRHAVSSRLHLQDLHLDRGDAAGTSRARST